MHTHMHTRTRAPPPCSCSAVEDMCMVFHVTVRNLAADFLKEMQRHYYATPTSYLELIQTYKELLGNKRKMVCQGGGA